MEGNKRDLERLREYKYFLRLKLQKCLNVSEEDALEIIQLMEQEDILKLEAPLISEKKTEILIEDRHLSSNELSMTSCKAGNIFLNAYLDWKELTGFICSSVGTVSGLEWGKPLLFWTSVIACIISASRLADIQLDENKTAIIMALQKYKKHRLYTTTESRCKCEANEILKINGYQELSDMQFSKEISRLVRYGCVDLIDGNVKLKEIIFIRY